MKYNLNSSNYVMSNRQTFDYLKDHVSDRFEPCDSDNLVW